MPADAAAVSAAFGLGVPAGPLVPVARGELGIVSRLATDTGVWAVKELVHPDERTDSVDEIDDVGFQVAAAAAGVRLPLPRRSPAGRVVEWVDGVPWRVHEWADLGPPITAADAHVAGRTLGLIHGLRFPAPGKVDPWYCAPLGPAAWAALLSYTEGAPFHPWLVEVAPALLAAEELLPAAYSPEELIRCHLDYWGGNVFRDPDGGVTVVDWENSGAAPPRWELASALWDVCGSSVQACADFLAGYESGGGPATVAGVEDFALAFAVQSGLIDLYARRWVDSPGDPDARAGVLVRMQWYRERLLTLDVAASIVGGLAGG